MDVVPIRTHVARKHGLKVCLLIHRFNVDVAAFFVEIVDGVGGVIEVYYVTALDWVTVCIFKHLDTLQKPQIQLR